MQNAHEREPGRADREREALREQIAAYEDEERLQRRIDREFAIGHVHT